MCKPIDVPHVAPGWGCCKCNTYNSVHREKCKICNHEQCGISDEEMAKLKLAEELLGL